MRLKLFTAVTIFAIAPIVALAQKDDPARQASKPALEDAQKVVQAIGNDKNKFKAYCDLVKLQEQMEKAEEKTIAKQSMRSSPRRTPSNSKLVPSTKGSWKD